MVRGTPDGLEFVFDARPFRESADDLWVKLAERPDFYRGSAALVVLGEALPQPPEFGLFLERVREFGIDVHGLRGPSGARDLATSNDLSFKLQGAVANVRSLDADFAGARADLARRRRRGPVTVTAVASVASVASQREPSTLFVRSTLRGGKSLQQLGNVVVVGDVNPGAEIVASGDVVVFGTLRGTVHAGAQGDESARVFAIELMPTQLRIAKYIAAESETVRSRPVAEEAFIQQGRIVIAPRGVAR